MCTDFWGVHNSRQTARGCRRSTDLLVLLRRHQRGLDLEDGYAAGERRLAACRSEGARAAAGASRDQHPRALGRCSSTCA